MSKRQKKLANTRRSLRTAQKKLLNAERELAAMRQANQQIADEVLDARIRRTVEGFVDLGKFTLEEDRTTPADHGMVMMFQPFQVENLMSTAIGFFQAGSAGVPTYMNWHMINFALRADTLQAQVQDEIDRVTGSHRRPTWEDRRNMPLIMAVVWEMLRWKAIAPLSAPRRAEVDFTCDGFFYPAGITVMANYWAVHNDPSVWPNPEKFDPGRFLNDDGSATCERPKRII
ncbi:hypothetical protein HPB52_015895 [Rhipicephalus sanguineus]|uniref:Cytochrome P450 n=1 Tax=Rhipicephalus sanguineus TaxID=34632 RepID=A0A9D4PP23_RHISA|nr:hypothetical protein HPB52_015895 [Rhipicephalus sanguineus]